nr:glycoside hydrolase domain-containing protein [Microbacterium sp. JB110]
MVDRRLRHRAPRRRPRRRHVVERFQTRRTFWQNLFAPPRRTRSPPARTTGRSSMRPTWDPASGSPAGTRQRGAVPLDGAAEHHRPGVRARRPEATAERLDTFMTHLNSGANEPYLWAGNEPNFLVPWIYNYLGQPWKTQASVDRVRTSLCSRRSPTARGQRDARRDVELVRLGRDGPRARDARHAPAHA